MSVACCFFEEPSPYNLVIEQGENWTLLLVLLLWVCKVFSAAKLADRRRSILDRTFLVDVGFFSSKLLDSRFKPRYLNPDTARILIVTAAANDSLLGAFAVVRRTLLTNITIVIVVDAFNLAATTYRFESVHSAKNSGMVRIRTFAAGASASPHEFVSIFLSLSGCHYLHRSPRRIVDAFSCRR